MTRINANINPMWLADEHLIAEHREIARLPKLAAKALNDSNFGSKNIPSKFTLGTGHVVFFYFKYHFTRDRYNLLYNECKRRNINVEYYESAWNDVWCKALKDTGRWFTACAHSNSSYIPTIEDDIIVLARIIHNVTKSKKSTYHMNHVKMSKEDYLKHLVNCIVEIQTKKED